MVHVHRPRRRRAVHRLLRRRVARGWWIAGGWWVAGRWRWVLVLHLRRLAWVGGCLGGYAAGCLQSGLREVSPEGASTVDKGVAE